MKTNQSRGTTKSPTQQADHAAEEGQEVFHSGCGMIGDRYRQTPSTTSFQMQRTRYCWVRTPTGPVKLVASHAMKQMSRGALQ